MQRLQGKIDREPEANRLVAQIAALDRRVR